MEEAHGILGAIKPIIALLLLWAGAAVMRMRQQRAFAGEPVAEAA